MSRLLKIDKCHYCNSLVTGQVGMNKCGWAICRYYCSMVSDESNKTTKLKEIEEYPTIPDWCPLEKSK